MDQTKENGATGNGGAAGEDRPARTVAYLRVSTNGQDTAKNRADVLEFANNKDFGRVEFIEETASGKKPWRERAIAGAVDSLKAGDRLIVPELSRLGRSMLEILEILQVALKNGIAIYAVKGGWELGDNLQSKIIAVVMAIAAEIERDLISARTKEALDARKAMVDKDGEWVSRSGRKCTRLGRPKGPGKSKLDHRRDEIIKLIGLGVPKIRVAEKMGCSSANLYNWLQKNGVGV